MADRDMRVNLRVDSRGAIAGLEQTAQAAAEADRALEQISDADIRFEAGQALGDLRQLETRLGKLSAEDQQVVIRAQTDQAEQSIANIERQLGDLRGLSDQQVRVLLLARDEASRRVDQLQSKVRDLDGTKAEVNVTADTSGIDSALNALPGRLGSIKEVFTGPAGVVAGVAALGAAVVNMAGDTANAAQEIETIMTLTGASAEEASRLRAAFALVGIEGRDLQDVILQANGVLQQTPELARQLGLTLRGNVIQNFLEASRAAQGIADPVQRAAVQSRLFGEEGVRQVARLISEFGSLETAMGQVSDTQVFTPETLAQAHELRESVRQLQSNVRDLTTEISQDTIPIIVSFVGVLGDLVGGIDRVGSSIESFGERNRRALGPLGDFLGMLTGATALDDYREKLERTFDTARGGDWGTAAVLEQVDAVEKVNEQYDKNLDLQAELFDKAQRQAGAAAAQAEAERQAAHVLDVVEEARERVTDAQDRQRQSLVGVAEAQRAAADAATDITRAEEDASKAHDGIAQAQERVAESLQDIADARARAVEAQEAIGRAEQGRLRLLDDIAEAQGRALQAEEAIADARRRAADDQLSADQDVELAERRLADARRNLRIVGNSATADEWADAQDRVREAEVGLDRARRHAGDVRVEGPERVIEAQRRAAEATDAVTAAQQRYLDSADQVAEARRRHVEAIRAIGEAERRHQETLAGVAEAQQRWQDSLAGVRQAQERYQQSLGNIARAQEDYARSQAAVAQAQRGVADAVERIAAQLPGITQAAAEARAAQLGLKSASDDAGGSLLAQIAAAQQVRAAVVAELGPNSPAVKSIDVYIATLQRAVGAVSDVGKAVRMQLPGGGRFGSADAAERALTPGVGTIFNNTFNVHAVDPAGSADEINRRLGQQVVTGRRAFSGARGTPVPR